MPDHTYIKWKHLVAKATQHKHWRTSPALCCVPSMRASQKVVCVLEDFERSRPLLAQLVHLGAHVQVWDASSLYIDTAAAPPSTDIVYFFRTSPSCGDRGRPWSLNSSKLLASYLEASGCCVLHGCKSLEFESCKWSQVRLLHHVGIRTPRTVLVSGTTSQLIESTKLGLKELGIANVKQDTDQDKILAGAWVKPCCGGSGTGAMRTEDVFRVYQMQTMAKHRKLKDSVFGTPPNKALLIQPENAKPKRLVHSQNGQSRKRLMRTFYRAEFVDRRLLYVLQVTAMDTAVSACPCDTRTSKDIRYSIVNSARDIFLSRTTHTAKHLDMRWNQFVRSCCQYMERAGMYIAAFEFVICDNSGDPVVFDVNANTNYNEAAEKNSRLPSGYGAAALCILNYGLRFLHDNQLVYEACKTR